MNIEYRIITAKQGKSLGAPDPAWSSTWDDEIENSWNYSTTYLYLFQDDVPVKYIACDGGEPEDQSFYRDLDWIPGALAEAYKLGLAHGKAGL